MAGVVRVRRPARANPAVRNLPLYGGAAVDEQLLEPSGGNRARLRGRLGLHRLSAEVAEPVLVALYSIPKITLYPIVLLVFGIGVPAKIAFGAIHGIVPVAIFTMNAVRNINPVLIKTARVLKLSRWRAIRFVLFPAALPEIFSSIRIGFSLTLIGTLLGEMFGSQRGLGFLLMTAIGLQNVRVIMAVTLLLVLFAAGVSTLLLTIDRQLHRRV